MLWKRIWTMLQCSAFAKHRRSKDICCVLSHSKSQDLRPHMRASFSPANLFHQKSSGTVQMVAISCVWRRPWVNLETWIEHVDVSSATFEFTKWSDGSKRSVQLRTFARSYQKYHIRVVLIHANTESKTTMCKRVQKRPTSNECSRVYDDVRGGTRK
jgi:hypothetical protein